MVTSDVNLVLECDHFVEGEESFSDFIYVFCTNIKFNIML